MEVGSETKTSVLMWLMISCHCYDKDPCYVFVLRENHDYTVVDVNFHLSVYLLSRGLSAALSWRGTPRHMFPSSPSNTHFMLNFVLGIMEDMVLFPKECLNRADTLKMFHKFLLMKYYRMSLQLEGRRSEPESNKCV